MRIIYLASHGNKKSDDTEGHITRALQELGHDVIRIHEQHVILSDFPDGDILLFHKGGVAIKDVLKQVKYKKVCWYFDKIWDSRIKWFNEIYPLVDIMFMTDGTWAEKYPDKCKVLRQGIGNTKNGKASSNVIDIAFIGSLYHDRVDWFNRLNDKFEVKNVTDVFNEQLNNLCATTKIIVAPKYPQDNLYWSNRPYLITGSGGFLIHPYLRGLYEEWGDNLVYYKDDQELYKKIDFYLRNPAEREKARKKMVNFCRKNFTYKQRVEEFINLVKNK